MGYPNALQGLHRGLSCLDGDEGLTLTRRVSPQWSGSLHNSFTSLLSSGPVWSAVYPTPSLLHGKQLTSQHHLLLQFLPQGVHWWKHCMADHFPAPALKYTASSFLQAFVSAVLHFSLAASFIKKIFFRGRVPCCLSTTTTPLQSRQGTRELLPSCWPLQKPPPTLQHQSLSGFPSQPFFPRIPSPLKPSTCWPRLTMPFCIQPTS